MSSITLFAQQYTVTTYSELDGLPSTEVNSIVQDKQGVMWFATRDGIASFDGVNWKKYSIAVNENMTASTDIAHILCDTDGTVFAVSEYKENGIVILKLVDGVFKVVSNYYLKFNDIMLRRLNSACIFKDGQYSTIAVCIPYTGVVLLKNNSWIFLSEKDGFPTHEITHIASNSNTLFMSTTKGLFKYSDGKITKYKISLPFSSDSVLGVAFEDSQRFSRYNLKHDRLWIAGQNWLGFISLDNPDIFLKCPLKSASFSGSSIHIFPDYYGGVFIGDEYSIFYYCSSDKSFKEVSLLYGLTTSRLSSAYVDRERVFWIVSKRGVNKIASRAFSNYQRSDGMAEDEATSICEMNDLGLVVTHNHHISILKDENIITKKIPIMPENISNANRLLEGIPDSKNNLWLSFSLNGFYRMDKNYRFTHYPLNLTGRDGYNRPSACNILEFDGQILGITSQGILKLDGNRFINYKVKEFDRVFVRKGFLLKDNSILICSGGSGIYLVNNDTVKNIQSDHSHESNNVFSCLELENNELLLGTRAGLFCYQNNKIRKFNKNGFSIDNPVYFIFKNNHELWFGTDAGIIKWDGNYSTNYNQYKGLVGTEANRSAAFKDSNGNLWFGTNLSLSKYNPIFDSFDTSPLVFINHLSTANTDIPLNNSPVIIPDNGNSFTVNIQVSSFLNEKRNKYRYKLEDYDMNWIEEHYPYKFDIRYDNLNPGSYTFSIQACSASGIWSDIKHSPEIIITTAFVKSVYFDILSVLLLLFIFIFSIKYFYQRKYSHFLKTEIEKARIEINQSEKRYHTIFHNSTDAIYITSVEGKLVDINPAGLRLLGYASKEEAINSSIIDRHYINTIDRIKFQNKIRKYNAVKDFKLTIKTIQKNMLTVTVNASAIRNEKGKIVGYSGILRDISEKEKLEEQLIKAQKMEAIGILAGGVAHDLNNILSGITTYPELLLLKLSENDPNRSFVETIQKAGIRASAIVQDLLTLSRRGINSDSVVNLNRIINDYMTSPEFDKMYSFHKNCRFTLNLEDELPNMLGSKVHLSKIIMNLCSNAAESMPDGGEITITTQVLYTKKKITKTDTVEEGQYIVCTIEDEGTGIASHEIPHLFEPFYTKKKLGRSGTGLGMSIVWATVKDHKGFIAIDSEEGKGTIIRLYFPPTEDIVSSDPEQTDLEPFAGTEKILIVDDMEEQRDICSAILKKLGYDVFTAESGEKAIDFVKENDVDLILLDMIMSPGIDGQQTFMEIKKIKPDQKAIVVSGFSESEKIKKTLKMGAFDLVKKPYSIHVLGKTIRQALETDTDS